MNDKILPKADLPNTVGYKFYAVLIDGTIVEDEVKINDNGLPDCTYFRQMIGWFTR
jgi:hypothetical protein